MDILKDFNSDIQIASPRLRFTSSFIDFVSIWAIIFILGIFWGKPIHDKDGFGYSLSGIPALITFIGAFILLPISEGLTGQTIGKRLCKIVVKKKDLSPTNIFISLIRHLFILVDIIFFIGLILIATTKKRQRIGDMVAGTYVVLQ